MAKRNSWTFNVLNVHRDKPLERVMNIFYNIQLTTRDNVRVDISHEFTNCNKMYVKYLAQLKIAYYIVYRIHN